MIDKVKFIDRTLLLLKKEMEENLPNEAILEEMVEKLNKILEKFLN
jgi:hypothetical protein